MKILILKPSSLGDVVHALPVLRLLRLEFPQSEIHWWIESSLQPLLEGDSDLNDLRPFNRREWDSPKKWLTELRAEWSLRRERFDWVIDLQGLARSALFAWLADGAMTVGQDSGREGARAMYDVAVPRSSTDMHAVDWNLALVKAMGVPVDREYEWLPVRTEAEKEVRRLAGRGRWVLLCPGARWDNKRWPANAFADLAGMLLNAHPRHRIAVIGGRDEHDVGARVAALDDKRCLDLTGATSLPELVEWIRRSDLLICNDSGPMHIAAAVGTPVVAMFGPTNPDRTGPYGLNGEVLRAGLPCVPCMKSTCDWDVDRECLLSIEPALAAESVGRLLGC